MEIKCEKASTENGTMGDKSSNGTTFFGVLKKRHQRPKAHSNGLQANDKEYIVVTANMYLCYVNMCV